MKIKLITFLLSLVVIFNLNAQEKEISFKIEEKIKGREEIYRTIPVYGKGLIVLVAKAGRGYTYNKAFPWDLRYYDLDLNLKLHTPIKSKATIHPSKIFGVPSGDKIIFIKDYGVGKSVIRQISLDGTFTEHQISKEKWKTASPGNLKHVFVTDSAVCYISSKNGDEAHPKKKAEEKLILYKVKFDSYKSKKMNLKLPKINSDVKKTSFWSYENHNEEGIYFASINTVKMDNGFTINANIVKKDYYNTTLKKVKISFDRTNVERLNSVNAGGDDLTSSNGVMLPRSKCAIRIDTKNDHIYFFGLEQLKANVRENHMRTIFIKKYDFDGELLWNFDIEGLNAGTGDILSMDFLIKDNQTVRLSTSGIYWELSGDGKPLVAGKDDDSAREVYWEANKSRDKMFYRDDVDDYKNALIEHNDETGDVKLMLFPK